MIPLYERNARYVVTEDQLFKLMDIDDPQKLKLEIMRILDTQRIYGIKKMSDVQHEAHILRKLFISRGVPEDGK